MSLRDRPGPGVQGFPILFIATAESIYVQWTLPRTWTGTTVGALVPLDDFLEGLGKRSLGAGLVGGRPAPAVPTPGTLLPRRTSNLCSLGDHSVNCHCHPRGLGISCQQLMRRYPGLLEQRPGGEGGSQPGCE